MMLSFFYLRLRLDVECPLQQFLHLGRWQMECFAALCHVAFETVMRKFPQFQGFTVVDALRIFERRILNVFLFQIFKPQFTRLVRESTVKGERLVAREKYGIALRAKPQIKVDDFKGLDFRTAKRTFTHA